MNIRELKQKQLELQKKLETREVLSNPAKIKELSIEFSRITETLERGERLLELTQKIKEAEEMARENDGDLKKMAEEELIALLAKKTQLEKNTEATEDTPQNIVMEIRAGAGGEEAALFAEQLFQMYSKFAGKQGWNTVLLDESKSDLGGYKEVIFEINGNNVYKTLRWESGVHRVQRIPETEKMGRVHTSTASVAVLPQAREVDVEIRPQDIKIEFFRSSGPGGQNVNKVETAVRIYHLPTGLVVSCQESRSQQKNRERAFTVLRSRLLDARLQEKAKKHAAERREQIGTADRSEKIRTYNFPQDRITDHRIRESWHNIPEVMEGNLDEIVEAFSNFKS